MNSPFLRNRQRLLARQAAGAAPAATAATAPDPATAAGQEYAALKVLLDDNLRALSDIESHEARQPKKVEFAKAFAPWIDGVIAADEAVQDEILLTVMVWALDYGDLAYCLVLGEFALRHGLDMPERYKRSVACFLREDIAQLALDDPDAVDHAMLVRIDQLTGESDMPDPAKAKLDKALGRSWAAKAAAFDASDDNAPAGGAASFAQQGLEHFRRALKLDGKAGVKKDIDRLERLLRDARAAEADEKD